MAIVNPRLVTLARAVVLFAASVTAGLGLASEGDVWRGAFVALVGALYSLLTASEQSPRRSSRGGGHLAFPALAVGDVVLISALVWVTGGVSSEYYLLYFVPVSVAAARLDTRSGLATCVAAGCAYSVVLLLAPTQPPVLSMKLIRAMAVLAGALVIALFFALLGRETRLADDLRDTLHHSLRRVAAVYEIAHAANTGTDLTGVLTIILDHAARAANAANGSVFLLSECKTESSDHDATGQLKLVASLYPPASSGEPAVQPDIEPAYEAIRTAQPTTTTIALPGESQLAAVAYVPLHSPASTLGVLALVSPQNRAFARRQLDFLTSLCAEAALAIENARLRSELKRLAVTDPLTGIPNRREVERHLSLELERAARHRRPLSLLMLDVDNLKLVNDSHGHAAGDEVLIAAARLMQQSIRSSEIAARVGGDEFTIVLPETDARGALALAERLVEALPEVLRAWPGLADGEVISAVVGFSIGIAGSDDGTIGANALTARADDALYEAKRTGKNRVCVNSPEPAAR